jgi:hypothetical protein
VKGDIEYEPTKQAAASYLATARGPGCTLTIFQKITHIGWEWDFDYLTVSRRRR